MNIISRYQESLAKQELHPDRSQAKAVKILQRYLKEEPVWWERFLPFTHKPTKQGVYLWGPVGRGKTLLMDMFFESLTTTQKQRWHFQEFMAFIHQQLHSYQGQENPLLHIVQSFTQDICVLCLDEFLVEDIADAMLLGGLLEALFAEKITLVITGNVAPADLYAKGWQRELFIPAIELLKKHLDIVHLNENIDYRRQAKPEHVTYFYPVTKDIDDHFEKLFIEHVEPPIHRDTSLEINNHILKVKQMGTHAIWCTFQDLCMHAHNAQDYLILTELFKTLLLSHVPVLSHDHEDAARRFISLVDACYDRRIRLIISAAVPLENLYQGRQLRMVFERTLSRLYEMQTAQYLK